MLHPSRLPWQYAVPVRRAEFLPLHSLHRKLNIEVDLGSIQRSFGRANGSEHRLFCDLQTKVSGNGKGRLGSGRSGYFDRFYLKGIGRTPLAANWSRPKDLWHSTGHLTGDAAAREFLVTRYLAARNQSALIVPCEGVLVREISPEFAPIWRKIYRGEDPSPPPAGRRLQAISVKPGDFARFSNFVWLLNHQLPPDRVPFSDHLRLLWSMLDPAGEEPPKRVHPDALADRMDQAFLSTLHRFREFFRIGLHWGSIVNNFTADGRMVDLETPLVFARPFIGLVRPPRGRSGMERLMGFNVIEAVREIRAFLEYLDFRLAYLEQSPYVLYEEDRVFAGALRGALSRRFSGRHLLMNPPALTRWALGWMREDLLLGARDARTLESLLAEVCRSWLTEPRSPQETTLARLPIAFDRPRGLGESRNEAWKWSGFPSFCRFREEEVAAADFFAAQETAVGRCTQPREFLEELRRASRSIGEFYGGR